MSVLKTNWAENLACVAAFVLVTLLSNYFQAPLTYQDGKGWDGVYYHKMAGQFANAQPIRAEAPYCNRIGLPFLAAKVGKGDLQFGFKAVNLAANALILVAFMIWLRLQLKDWRVRLAIVLLLLTQWFSPFRFIFWYPATVDNIQYLFLLLGLLGLHLARTRPVAGIVWVSVVTFVGVPFRETVILVAAAMPFLNNPIHFRNIASRSSVASAMNMAHPARWMYLLPFLSGLVATVCVHQFVGRVDDGYSYLRTVYQCLYTKPLPTYIHAGLIAFGPVLALVIYYWHGAWAFLKSNQHLLAYTAATLVLAYVGGNDTERFMYMAMPVVYVLVGRAIEEYLPLLRSQKLLLFALCAAQLLAHRVFWTFPDFPNDFRSPLPVLTVLGSQFQYLDLYSYYGRRMIEALSLIEYVAFIGVVIWWLNNRARRSLVRSNETGGVSPQTSAIPVPVFSGARQS
jgi:hypothetical protein